MFQSEGLFKDVSCPYFLYGLCERPHCHFKHSRKEESLARIEAEASKKETETDESYTAPTSSLQKTLQAIEENIISEKKKLLVKDVGPEEQIQVKKQAKKPAKNKPTGTPEYNPTPLQDLKKEKTERKHGRSKYDLALLHKPETDSEYDPMCNYSTNTCSSNNNQGSVPDYAKTLQSNGGVKRTADLEDEEDTSPLAKIPKFVSVDYTPTGIEHDGSDEEPVGEKEDWFSENESEKSNDSGNVDSVERSEKNVKVEQSEVMSDDKKSLPIEFTSDGFVKFTPVNNESKKRTGDKNDKSNSCNTSMKTKDKLSKEKTEDIATRKTEKGADLHVKPREKSNDNIFNLFKDEFDKVFEGSNSPREKDGFSSKSKFNSNSDKPRRTSSESDSKFKSAERKSKDPKSDKHTHNNHKPHSDRKSPQESSSSGHRNESSHRSLSNEKHSSSSSKQSSSLSKHSNSSSRDVKTSSSSHKHDKHNSNHHEHNAKHDKHNSNHHEHNSKHDKHNSNHEHNLKHDKHNSNHHEHNSKHDKHSSKHDYHDKHNSKHDNHDKHKSKHDKHEKHSSKHDKHDSKYSSKRHGDSDSKKSHKDRNNSGHSSKKKSIVNLDVDLFGVDAVNMANSRQVEDDFSDLDKYFEDEDPFEECLRIFNEDKGKTEAGKAVEKKKSKKSSTSDNNEPAVAGKKRVALKENEEKVKRQKVDDKPKPKPSPAQVMMNRYKMMQERALQEEQDRKDKIKAKVREMQADKKANQPPPAASSSIPGSAATFTTYMNNKNKKTNAITVAKGAKRKAHTPTVAIEKLKRPVVEVSSSSKVPANCRQRYLNIFIDECLKLCSSEKEAYDKAKEEEQAVFTRCSNKQIYLNMAVNTVKRIRKEVEEKKNKPSKNGSKSKTKINHAMMLDGAHAAKTTFTLNRSGGAVKLREEDFLGVELYKRLKPYILDEEQLNINNYPRQDPTKGGCAMFMVEEDTKLKGSVKGYEKICRRCGKPFEVYPNGKYPKKEECVYHWGKAWKKRVTGTIDTRYTCCSGDMSAAGCQVAKAHVHETNKKENLSGYMKTIPCSPPIDGDYGVYAMDCEMVYTTMGMELARVTVVGGDCEIAYESLVQPDNPVVDCNTRFSGILDEDLEDVQTSLRDVQAVLLSLFSDKTILIGHSLESDLTALKLIHSTVVDTAIVFPHRMGLPYKRALKNLMIEYLKKIIQDDVAGHDSQEDAISCIQLMQYKLKEDARKEARRLSN